MERKPRSMSSISFTPPTESSKSPHENLYSGTWARHRLSCWRCEFPLLFAGQDVELELVGLESPDEPPDDGACALEQLAWLASGCVEAVPQVQRRGGPHGSLAGDAVGLARHAELFGRLTHGLPEPVHNERMRAFQNPTWLKLRSIGRSSI